MKRLIANVSITLPNRQVDGIWQAGKLITAGKEIPTEGLDDSHIEAWLANGTVRVEGEDTKLTDVEALRLEDNVNVSSVTSDPDKKDTLDDGLDLVGSDKDEAIADALASAVADKSGDPALAAKLAGIQSEQAEDGVESSDDEVEPSSIEVNAETGEVTETGGEPSFEEEADSQVSN